MLNKKVIGRLGNQMFQYATIRAFQEKYNLEDDKMNLDFSEVYARADEGFYNELTNFNVRSFSSKKMKKTIVQKILILYSNIVKLFYKFFCKIYKKRNYDQCLYSFEKRIQPFFNKFGLYSFRLGYYDFKNSRVKNKCFYGTFEAHDYFDNIKEELKKEFTPKYGVLNKNIDMYNDILSSESVCVTIRRGDFISNESNRKRFYICTPKYFEVAIDMIKKYVKNPKFFIFSDDINWCKKNLKLPKNCCFETGDDPVWEKIRLMYSCKHFIISNSTFSWWAQYLSSNSKKIVIAPSVWKYNTYFKDGEQIDLYEKNWKLVDIGVLNNDE